MRPDLREEPVAAGNIAVVHKGEDLLVGVLQKAPPELHHGVEHSQRRNNAPGQRDDQEKVEFVPGPVVKTAAPILQHSAGCCCRCRPKRLTKITSFRLSGTFR